MAFDHRVCGALDACLCRLQRRRTLAAVQHLFGPSKNRKSQEKASRQAEPTQKGPTADRVSEIHPRRTGGYYQGDATGKWDSTTVRRRPEVSSQRTE